MFFRLFLIISVFLSGCTSQLWQAPSYDEKITGFFGVKEKELVIVAGQKYSYVFEASVKFKAVLTESRTNEFNPIYRKFRLDKNNNVTGHLSLVSYKSTDKQKLRELGFVEDKYGNMEINFQLKGKRYEVEGEYPFEKLEDDHYVLVETPENGIAKAGKIVVTPVTIAIDVLAVVPVGALFAILGIMNEYDL
jgi:hypothetical protein